MHVVLLRRVHGQFGRRQPEDQPAVTHIDVGELEARSAAGLLLQMIECAPMIMAMASR